MARAERPPEILSVIEDDPDIQFLIRTIFALDSRFTVANMSETTEDALECARTSVPGIIVLDHGEAGSLTGLDAAPLLGPVARYHG